MTEQQHIIHVANADVKKRGSVIVLELADTNEAMSVAGLIAQETGRGVTVLDSQLAIVGTIAAASVQ